MMSDSEYREFLDALARKHLRLTRIRRKHFMEMDHLQYTLSRLENLRRLLSVAEQDIDDKELLNVLAKKLEQSHLGEVLNEMERCGAMSAIEEDPQTLFANLRRSAIPDEDVEMLKLAGHSDPEAELLLIIHYSRTHLGHSRFDYNSDTRSPVEFACRAEAASEREVRETPGLPYAMPRLGRQKSCKAACAWQTFSRRSPVPTGVKQ